MEKILDLTVIKVTTFVEDETFCPYWQYVDNVGETLKILAHITLIAGRTYTTSCFMAPWNSEKSHGFDL